LIAGIYGMNFDWMPELHWRAGYFISLAVMAGIGAGLLGFFRYNRWL
jgi:magnesium transporter